MKKQEHKPVRGEYLHEVHRDTGLFSKEIELRPVNNNGSGMGQMEINLGPLRFYHFIKVKLFHLTPKQNTHIAFYQTG